MRRFLPILLAASCLADPPRQGDLESVTLTGRVRLDRNNGADGVALRSSGVRVEGVTEMGNVGDWRLSLNASAAGESHQLASGSGPALPTYEAVRELDLGVVVSSPANPAGGPSRFFAFEVGSRTADEARLEQGVATSFVGGSTWKVDDTLSLGFLVLAEDREVEDDLFLIVPTFRWAFAQDWTLATGRKSLVLSNLWAKDETLSLTVGYEGEETRLQDVAGAEARLLDQRLFADLGYGWKARGWDIRATVGCELDAELEFQVGGVTTTADPGQGLRLGLIGKYKL